MDLHQLTPRRLTFFRHVMYSLKSSSLKSIAGTYAKGCVSNKRIKRAEHI
jgi:hypothetical protein